MLRLELQISENGSDHGRCERPIDSQCALHIGGFDKDVVEDPFGTHGAATEGDGASSRGQYLSSLQRLPR